MGASLATVANFAADFLGRTVYTLATPQGRAIHMPHPAIRE